MNKCYLCGDFKPVRTYSSYDIYYLMMGWPFVKVYTSICEDCDRARKIIDKETEEKNLAEAKKKKEKEISDWKKERDKILKENK